MLVRPDWKMTSEAVVSLDRLTDIFSIDPNVRYIGVVDKNDNVLLSKRKEGVAPVDPNDRDEETVSVYPPLIMRAVERLEPILGNAQGVQIPYEKVLLAMYRVQDLLIIVTLNPVPEAPLLTLRIGDEVKRLLQVS